MISNLLGLGMASIAQEFATVENPPGFVYIRPEDVESARQAFGRIGFTLSALGVIALGILIAWSGTLPRWLGWLGIAAGVSMFFIWVEAATTIHRLGGAGYLLWLAIMGGWLVVRGTHFESANV